MAAKLKNEKQRINLCEAEKEGGVAWGGGSKLK